MRTQPSLRERIQLGKYITDLAFRHSSPLWRITFHDRCFRLNLPCRPRARGSVDGGSRNGTRVRPISALEDTATESAGGPPQDSLPQLGGQGKALREDEGDTQCTGRDSYTSTEADSEDGEEDAGEGWRSKETKAYLWNSAWGLLLERARLDFQRSMETQALEEELLTKGQTSGASASEEEEGDRNGQSLLGTILERIDRPRMAEQFLDAFYAVQRRGKIHREGMVGMLRHWKKLSDLAGQDLTLGVGAAIANALKVKAWELRYREGDTVKGSGSWTGHSSLGSIHTPNSFQGRLSSKRLPTAVEEGPMGLLLEEERAAVEAGAARLKASPLFRERDDGYTGLLLIEVDRTEDRVIVASNQAYLDVFLGPGFLLSESLVRGCLEPFLFAAFVAHSDRDTWFRMNLEALCSPRFRPERGSRKDGAPRRERLLFSEFLKIFSRDGHVRLYWARLAQLEASMREGEEEKMHFLLWMEPVPASRYITDRPEKTTHSKTTLFRQRPIAETGSLSREARDVCASAGKGEELGWRPLKLQDFSETEEKGDEASSGCGERQQVALQKRSPPSLFFPALASVPLPPGTSLPSFPSSWTVNTDQTRTGPPSGFLSPSGFPTPPSLFQSYSPSHPSSRYPLDSPACPISSTLPDMFEIKSDFIKGLLPADPKTGLAGKSHGENTATNPVVEVKCKHTTKREVLRKISKISCARNEGEAQEVFQVTAESKHHDERQQQERQLQQQQQQQQQEQQNHQQEQPGLPQQQQMILAGG
ncbi:hypothetical protein NSK_005804 [Nannochloropsis salina CCMP1776]|uniref:Uncharacterized protein n=1 Tax=Nannochloropsis salina CCMP1776 TaxID=1027361 RepID=A0A4D9D2L4_9STRA|nr:hypothetical protein NSK_005804 [Nannochloropsis salina CCMP1776]|eukprot:TFJ82888.1 hypothetical protein NSK_005804 [Nannochloropsis salina CCMP1776]